MPSLAPGLSAPTGTPLVDPVAAPPSPRRLPWEVLVLVVFVAAAFFLRLADVPLLGEETRRALIAREMVETGDWIVPRQQDVPRLTKPPIQYWAIALSRFLFGDTLFAIRLPSVLCILLTALVIQFYCRRFLSRAGALAAALGFLTMVEILHSGRFAQIDAMFTFFLSAALLLWHAGYLSRWPAWRTWSIAYAFAALAALTKGPQAPIYFAAGVGIHLLARRDWRFLFSWGHLLGLVIFALLVGAWLVPFWLEVGTANVFLLFAGESIGRSLSPNFIKHFLRFPGEILLATLPSCVFLFVYLSRRFRNTLGEARLPVLFLFGCFAFALPTCWLPPGGEARYLMPVYPCLGCLAAVVLERLAAHAPAWARGRAWASFRWIGAGVMLLCAVAAVLWVAGLLPAKLGTLSASFLAALGYALLVLGLLAIFWRSLRPAGPSPFLAHIALACFFGLTYNWLIMGRLQTLLRDMETTVADGRALVPPGTRLVSIGWIQHRFAYYYPESIEVIPIGQLPPADACFCIECPGGVKPDLPFAWQMLGSVPVDRFRRDVPQLVVVIGRRLVDGAS